jgi:hypothetical protein
MNASNGPAKHGQNTEVTKKRTGETKLSTRFPSHDLKIKDQDSFKQAACQRQT